MPNTRETIEWLKSIKEKYIHGGDDAFDEKRRQAIDYAVSVLAHGVTVQEWISVKDRLPEKDGEHILVYYSDGWICDQYTPVDGGVTHWMPLPQPPKGE